MIAERLRDVRERISEAAERAGRAPDSVQLLAVTKTQDASRIREAIDAGHTLFGENRVQEAMDKFTGLPTVEVHLIGHLQRNKAKLVPGLFHWVESVDSLGVAEALSRRFEAAGLVCRVLLQFNSTGEESKSGYLEADALLEDAAQIHHLPGIELRGIMTIGPFVDDPAPIARAFATTRTLHERLQRAVPDAQVDTLSMGMTGDFPIAIAEGSTLVRIGSAIFGARA